MAQVLPARCRNLASAIKGHEMINLTDSAVNAVRTAIDGSSDPVKGLRIMVEAGGCAGWQYQMGLVANPEEDDTVVERDGVRVFVDMKSHELLTGTTIDFVVALEGSGFTFDNPNAKSSCSCGKSFG
jgi:iron-sulfur cluster assembly protein